MSKYLNTKGTILLQLELPITKLDAILKELDFPDIKKIGDLSFEQKRILILVAFREFLKGNLFLEEFSEIANHIKTFFPTESRTSEQEDFELMIYEAADMSLYARTFDSNYGNAFNGYIDTVWKYFNKYKEKLVALPEKYATPSPLEPN